MDICKIKEDFKKVIQYSQNIENPIVDNYIETWKNQKKKFIDLFGGEPIYKIPGKVSFELGSKEKHDRILHFADRIACFWGCEELGKFIEKQEDGFFDNLTVEDYLTWDGKTIKKGTKIIKAFKYFINQEKLLAELQNEASMIIQENKVEGQLCLSVHPLDFLSSSENNHNWRSCHSLDGEYRAGNLSYMLDNSTVICYLASDNLSKLPNFPENILWNSKKWRVLLFFSDDWNGIFAGRQYPFMTSTGLNYLLKEVFPKVGVIKNKWSEWTKFNSEENIKIIDMKNSTHYNDLLYSTCYKPPFYIYNKEVDDDLIFHIGHSAPCLRCGSAPIIGGEDTVLCPDCELKFGNSDDEIYGYCDCCGSRMYIDDGILVGDEVFCQDCYDKFTRVCDCCGEAVREEDITYIEEKDLFICRDCLEDENF